MLTLTITISAFGEEYNLMVVENTQSRDLIQVYACDISENCELLQASINDWTDINELEDFVAISSAKGVGHAFFGVAGTAVGALIGIGAGRGNLTAITVLTAPGIKLVVDSVGYFQNSLMISKVINGEYAGFSKDDIAEISRILIENSAEVNTSDDVTDPSGELYLD